VTLAFVFLSVEMGKEPRVVLELQKINGVSKSYLIYGVYDVLTRVEVGSLEELEAVISMISKIEDVRSTITFKVIE
jgi:DNA-binding Lrp family transcriptional regulator